MLVETRPRVEVIPTPQDDPYLSSLVATFTLREHMNQEPHPDDVEDMVSLMADSTTVVAFSENGAILATAGLVKTVRPSEGILVNVATANHHQRRGLGRKVVETIEQIAKNGGITHMDVFPLGDSVPFYVSLGYKHDTYRWIKQL